MDMRNDFIMRAILMLIEMIRKMLGKGEMQKEVLEQALSDVCGFDVEKLSSLPALLKQMIELSSQSDENKKALAVTCLHISEWRNMNPLKNALNQIGSLKDLSQKNSL